MKLNFSLTGLLMSCIATVNCATIINSLKTLPSKTIPLSTSTTTITGLKTIPSKTIPISTSTTTITTTTVPAFLNPEEPWYVGLDGRYHVFKAYHSVVSCKLKNDKSRSLEEYKECLDAIGVEEEVYKNYIKYYGANSSKTVPAYKVNNPYRKTCPANRDWETMYEKLAIGYCNTFNATVKKISENDGCNDKLFVCESSYPNKIKDNEIPTKILPISTTSTAKTIIPTIQASSSSNSKCCTGDNCTLSDFKCCQTDQPVVVNLVDKDGIWGIQQFEKEYEWCLYENMKPIITSPKSNIMVFYDNESTMTGDSPAMATVTLPYYVSEVNVSQNSGEDYRLCEGLYCYDYYSEFVYSEKKYTIYTKQNYPLTTVIQTSCQNKENCYTSTYTANPKHSISIKTLPTKTFPIITTTNKTPPVTITVTTTATTTTTKVPLSNTTTKIPITTKTIPCKPVTITFTERETITKKEKVTITVTDNKPIETSRCVEKWGQCGGTNYNGPTCCSSGSTCHEINQYYSQCI